MQGKIEIVGSHPSFCLTWENVLSKEGIYQPENNDKIRVVVMMGETGTPYPTSFSQVTGDIRLALDRTWRNTLFREVDEKMSVKFEGSRG